MIIKSYTAPTIAGALKKIREEFGGDAIVLNTRNCPVVESLTTGHRIEVTACIDEIAAGPNLLKNKNNNQESGLIGVNRQAPKIMVHDRVNLNPNVSKPVTGPEVESGSEFKPQINDIYHRLLNSDLPDHYAVDFCRELRLLSGSDHNILNTALDKLTEKVANVLSLGTEIRPGIKIAFVGSFGTDKGAVIAQMATQISTQLKLPTQLLSLDNIFVPDREANTESDVDDQVIQLIDTPNLDNNEQNQNEILNKLNDLRVNQLIMVFSVRARTGDLIDELPIYDLFNPSYLIATDLGKTSRWGGIITMTDFLNCPLAFISESRNAEETDNVLIAPDPATVAATLLRIEEGSEND